jgi:hypothetical protein
MEVKHSSHFRFSVGHGMKIVKIIVPLVFLALLIGYTKELRHLMNEGGWPGLAVVLICFGGLLVCYGVALMPIGSDVLARISAGTETATQTARMPRRSRLTPRYVPLHYRAEGAAAHLFSECLLWGGGCLILRGCSSGRYIEVAAGVAVLLCLLWFIVLIDRRERTRDMKALDDPNDNPRADQWSASVASAGHTTIGTGADETNR